MSRRIVVMAIVLVACGFLGGFIGWSQRPAEWPLGLWETVRVSVDAATYGHAFEHQAEGVLLYFVYGGTIGSVVAVLLMITLGRRFRERSPIAL